MNKKNYIFTSERLGYRTWKDEDIDIMVDMNSDERVMEHFPFALSRKETISLLERLNGIYDTYGYTYFAVEELETSELIGFIGIAYQDYDSLFNPSTDIGWRLKPSAWGKGYATEGANRTLRYAFEEKALERVVAVCTIGNVNSMRVMHKIGMERKEEFIHSKLLAYPEYSKCVWFEITKESWKKQITFS